MCGTIRDSPLLLLSRRDTLILLLTTATLALFLTTVPHPYPKTISLLTGDRHLVSIPAGGAFNLFGGSYFQSVSIESVPSTVGVHLYATPPVPDATVTLDHTATVSFKNRGYHVTRFDLYPGSEVSMFWGFTGPKQSKQHYPPHLVVLRGAKALRYFERGEMQYIGVEDVLWEEVNTGSGGVGWKVGEGVRGSGPTRTEERVRGSDDSHDQKEEIYFVFYVSVLGISVFWRPWIDMQKNILKATEPGVTEGWASFQIKCKTFSLENALATSKRSCRGTLKPCILDGGFRHLKEFHLVVVSPVTAKHGDVFTVRIGKSPRVLYYFWALVWCFVVVVVFGWVVLFVARFLLL
ncbi:hypothetical protein HDU98_000741 [Podochytrium sp. JEL0797]|nr:hypothetical protein HDU98_000741 [Podochytrium sp. JEL0797]